MGGIFSKKKKDKNLELTSEQQEEIKKMFETESFYSANEQNMRDDYVSTRVLMKMEKIRVKISKTVQRREEVYVYGIIFVISGIGIEISSMKKMNKFEMKLKHFTVSYIQQKGDENIETPFIAPNIDEVEDEQSKFFKKRQRS